MATLESKTYIATVDHSTDQPPPTSRSEHRLAAGNLSGASLAGANLSGANLAGWDLTGADLRGTNLSGANLSGACLAHAQMQRADLTGADLRTAQLGSAVLLAATLSGTTATGADFSNADLTGARVDLAAMCDTDLHEATLAGLAGFETADWTGADYLHADFAGAASVRRVIEDQTSLDELRNRRPVLAAAVKFARWASDCWRSPSRALLPAMLTVAVPAFGGAELSVIVLCGLFGAAFVASGRLARRSTPAPAVLAGSARPTLQGSGPAEESMDPSANPLRQERLSELVSHLSGAPLERSQQLLNESPRCKRTPGDSLLKVAQALVALRTPATPVAAMKPFSNPLPSDQRPDGVRRA